MFRPFAVFIGLRNVRAKNDNAFISFISLISMGGLVLGVSVLITVLSVMNGFEQQLEEKVLGIVPHAVILSPQRMLDWEAVSQQAKQNDPNILATAPFNRLQGMAGAKDSKLSSLLLTGVIPTLEKQVSVVDEQMIQGSFDSLQPNTKNIVIGKALAEVLKVGVGEQIMVIIPQGTNEPAGITPHYYQLTVTGIYQLKPDAEKLMVFIPLTTANTLVNQADGAQGIRLKLKNVFQASHSAQLATTLKQGLTTQNWTQTNGDMFKVINMQKSMTGLVLMLIILVACFNIVSTLMMMVTDKKAEIAILKTFGASPSTIIKIFMVQGGFIALIGTALGSVLGVVMAMSVGRLSGWVNRVFDLHLFDSYYVTQLPSKINSLEVVLVILASTILAVISTIYPAYKASITRPIDGLKGD
ncbi:MULTISPECIES: lipoprotein-releasing ABC transporter permease subunit [unclassified Moraxella]|uniref:lipoprotein-releasing ABC transporter permease subunit n=1 Tax=unclassified Moraxella TaxID=2685852 RepID=UPI003AF8A02B